MSDELKAELFRAAAVEGYNGDSGDELVFTTSATDGRVGFHRGVAVGAIVCGRKPGVLLLSVTSDGWLQRLGVSSEEQARVIVEALRKAWP